MEGRQDEDTVLEFRVYSGGTITIHLAGCAACRSKSCIQVCQNQGGPLHLDQQHALPGLLYSPAEIEHGKCNECLGCELECYLSGRQALHIDLPIVDFVEYLQSLKQPTVYLR